MESAESFLVCCIIFTLFTYLFQKEKEQKKLQQLQTSLWSLTSAAAATPQPSSLTGAPLTLALSQLSPGVGSFLN
jgi:hypothetical protein